MSEILVVLSCEFTQVRMGRPEGVGVSTAMDVQTYKDALLRKRGEILGAGGIKPLQASMENNTRQGDMAD